MVLEDLDSYMQKNETRPTSYTMHKNKLKVDERLKYNLQHHKTPRGEHWSLFLKINTFLDGDFFLT